MDSIPVRFPEIYEGLADAEGVLRISPDALTLEYQVKDSLLGVVKSGVSTAIIPFEHIDEVDFRSNFLWTSLNIRVDSMQIVGDVPGVKQGKGQTQDSSTVQERGCRDSARGIHQVIPKQAGQARR